MNTLETAFLHEQHGVLSLAAKTYMQALINASPEAKGQIMLGLARVFYEINRLDECANVLKTACESSDLRVKLEAELLEARLLMVSADFGGAKLRLAEAVCLALQMNDTSAQLYAQSHEARLPHLTELTGATSWATRAVIPQKTPFHWRVTIQFNQARAAIATRGNLLRTTLMLTGMLPQLEDYVGLKVEGLILHAVVLEARGQLERALMTLTDATRLAAPHGYVRTFLDEGAPVARMLYELNLRRVAPDYIPRVLSSFRAA